MPRSSFRLLAGMFALGTLSFGCSDSTETPAEDHTPVSFEIDGVATDTSDTVAFDANSNDTVQITFFNAADENLDEHEADHFSLMTFTPTDDVAATPLTGHHFQHHLVVGDVAGQVGDLDIGYGHDSEADEHNFHLHYRIQ